MKEQFVARFVAVQRTEKFGADRQSDNSVTVVPISVANRVGEQLAQNQGLG